jgi:hypothetical protein
VTAAPKPGWYLDPAGAEDRAGDPRFRWWDGADWTDAIADSAQAPVPTGRLRQRSGSQLRLRTVLVVSVGFLVFVGATIGAATLLWRDPGSTSAARSVSPVDQSGSSAVPAPGQADPTGHLDLQTRTATVGRATMQLPDDPYSLSPDPMMVRGVLDVLFLANAPVHERYQGRSSWSSAVLLGRLSPTLGHGDLESQGRAALGKFSWALFDGHRTTLTDVSSWDRSVSGCSGLLITGRVNYAVDQLPSRYDTVTALLVQQDDGSVVIAVSSVPNDADPQLAAQAAAALDSLTVR